VDVKGQNAGNRISKAFAVWRRFSVGAAPQLHLLVAPPLSRLIFAETGQIAIVALIQGDAPKNRQTRLTQFAQDQLAGLDRPPQSGAEGGVETNAQFCETASDCARLIDADRRERKVPPTSEDVPLVASLCPWRAMTSSRLFPVTPISAAT
jgi:hypothetical protein